MANDKSQSTSSTNYSVASITFTKQSYSIHRLFTIHEGITGDRPGRRYNVEVLNKSAFVFITAYWEAYIEDICREFSSFLVSSSNDHKNFPQKGRLAATRKLLENKDERKVWDLAGDGWKKIMSGYVKKLLNNFHTPSTSNVDKLFENLFNVSTLSSSWKWAGMSSVKARTKLDELINIRHNIAHGKEMPRSVTKKNAETYLNLIETLVQKTDKYLRDYGKQLINKYPW